MGFKKLALIISMFFIIGCGDDKVVNNDITSHPLMNSCYERYETQILDLGVNLYIADLRIEWAINDSTYTFNRYLLNNIPGVDPNTTALSISNGYMWFIENYSDRSFSYVLQQTESSLWNFDIQDWQETLALRPLRANFVIGINNEIQSSGFVYTVCE